MFLYAYLNTFKKFPWENRCQTLVHDNNKLLLGSQKEKYQPLVLLHAVTGAIEAAYSFWMTQSKLLRIYKQIYTKKLLSAESTFSAASSGIW